MKLFEELVFLLSASLEMCSCMGARVLHILLFSGALNLGGVVVQSQCSLQKLPHSPDMSTCDCGEKRTLISNKQIQNSAYTNVSLAKMEISFWSSLELVLR